jgi:hypothetical protein
MSVARYLYAFYNLAIPGIVETYRRPSGSDIVFRHSHARG